MSGVKFAHSDEDQLRATIVAAVAYGSICWDNVAGAGKFDAARATAAVDETVAEIRNIITAALVDLLDMEGVANEWNAAIEQALNTVEGLK